MVAGRDRQMVTGRRALAARSLLMSGLLLSGAAHAQVVEPLPPVQGPAAMPSDIPPQGLPGFPQTAPLGGVVADPYRVLGDDAPAFSGFDVLAGIGVDITASLRTEYSDNVARIGDGRALPSRFESKEDWRFTPVLSANLGRALGRQRLFLNTTVGRDFYARNNILNRNRFSVDGGLEWTLGHRCSGRLQGGYNERGTRLSDFAEVIPSTQRTTSLGVNAGCMTSTGLGFNAGYNWQELENSVDSRRYADLRSSGFNGRIYYQLGNRIDVSVQGHTQQIRYPYQLLPDASENGMRISALSGGLGYRLGQSIRLNGTLGKSWVKPRSPFAEDFSGTTWTVGAIYSGLRLGANVSAGRDVSSGSSGFTGYQVSDTVLATLSYRLGERISTSAGYAHLNQRNRGQGGQILPTLLSFEQNRYFIGADYRMNRILRAGIDFNHLKRSSNPTGFDYSANSVLLTLTASI